MTLFKINQGQQDAGFAVRHRNSLYTRFRRMFDRLLAANIDPQIFPELKEVYVENEAVEEKLDWFYNSSKDTIQFFIGGTGIGKTTTVECCFDTNNYQAKIKDKKLLLPFSLNANNIDTIEQMKTYLARIFYSGCKELNPELNYDKEKFYNFVDGNARYVLFEYEKAPVNKVRTIEELARSRSREYYLELLKFYLEEKKEINEVIIIIDNIESILDSQLLKRFIRLSIQSAMCLRNNKPLSFVKLLMTERPETYINLKKDNEMRNFLRSYTIDEAIVLDNPPSLFEIFRKRFDYFKKKESKKGHPLAKNLEEWKMSYDTLENICKKISINNDDTFLKLSNHNIRSALDTFQKILLSNFFEREGQEGPSFTVETSRFKKINKIRVLKALGYRNNQVYINDPFVQLLSNLFHYARGNSYRLLNIQIVKYFLEERKRNNQLFQILKKDEIINQISGVNYLEGASEIKQSVTKSIDYLLEREILSVSFTDDGSRTKLYLSPRGEILWDLIGENTILLELFRDDMWLDSKKYQNKSIREFPLDDKFKAVIKLADDLIKEEEKIIEDNASSYEGVFGAEPVSDQIVKGVKESIKRYYKPDSSANEQSAAIKEEVAKLRSRVEEMKNTCKKAEKKSSS